MLIAGGLFSLFTTNIFAQTTDLVNTKQSQTSTVKKDVLQNYIEISSLQMNKRPKAFSDLSLLVIFQMKIKQTYSNYI